MTRLIVVGFLIGLSIKLSAQVSAVVPGAREVAFAAFTPLLHHSWRADQAWANGQHFKQTITFSQQLEGQIIQVETMGYTDADQTVWGPRNHGIRRWNPAQSRMEFYEFDALGQLTTGYLSFQGDSIYYHYEYGGNKLTDAWLPIDAHTYRFVVGQMQDGKWTDTFLDTKFYAVMPTPELADATPLPYREIPDAPSTYNACTVTARMVDGLGFRYYWATEGLRLDDLNYRPSPEGRTMGETIEHIYDLTNVIYQTVLQEPIITDAAKTKLSFAEQRATTLLRLKAVSDMLRNSHPAEMSDLKIVFQRGDRQSAHPFWNAFNGPIADAIWHVGQVVMLRRAAGNPLDSRVNVFQGKLRE